MSQVEVSRQSVIPRHPRASESYMTLSFARSNELQNRAKTIEDTNEKVHWGATADSGQTS
jgi:hypothetical protein